MGEYNHPLTWHFIIEADSSGFVLTILSWIWPLEEGQKYHQELEAKQTASQQRSPGNSKQLKVRIKKQEERKILSEMKYFTSFVNS